ncbi:MAG TPA: GDSL-type esterase/lipase family protein [Acidobacteriaceae bacterium]|nr:GDSL-type esterase/lipase family protein [Acidobacteriaceae bacterium]
MGKLFLFLLLSFCICGCGATFRYHPTVVFLGDSITSGWDASWANQQQTFSQNNWLDVGVVGLTSSQIASRFDAYVSDLQPKAVHIIAGTNDVYPGWVLSDTSNNIQAMVQQAQKQHIDVVIGTIPPWGPGALPEKADPSQQRFQRIDQLNQWIIQFAEQQGIQVVDYHSLLAAANGENYVPAYTVDGVHPSAAGYAVMTPHTEQALNTEMALIPAQGFELQSLLPGGVFLDLFPLHAGLPIRGQRRL